ncbi:MAG: hypothetical protein U9R03_01170 [Candidatus Aerophobetes bacterium]|nr:hypothetical protein [Candidatus Aerophobetes bacterium]
MKVAAGWLVAQASCLCETCVGLIVNVAFDKKSDNIIIKKIVGKGVMSEKKTGGSYKGGGERETD